MEEAPVSCETLTEDLRKLAPKLSKEELLDAFEQGVELCKITPKKAGKGENGEKGEKRKSSPYNLFVKDCMGTRHKGMSECAIEWKAKKGK